MSPAQVTSRSFGLTLCCSNHKREGTRVRVSFALIDMRTSCVLSTMHSRRRIGRKRIASSEGALGGFGFRVEANALPFLAVALVCVCPSFQSTCHNLFLAAGGAVAYVSATLS